MAAPRRRRPIASDLDALASDVMLGGDLTQLYAQGPILDLSDAELRRLVEDYPIHAERVRAAYPGRPWIETVAPTP